MTSSPTHPASASLRTPLVNPVYAAATQDFRPRIVDIDAFALNELKGPSELTSHAGSFRDSPVCASLDTFVPFIVVMNSLNYQFWDLDPIAGLVRYQRDGAVGAMAMQDCFHDAWVAAIGPDVGDLSLEETVVVRLRAFHARIAKEGVAFMLGDIPDAASRKEVLLDVLDPVRLHAACRYILASLHRAPRLGWEDAVALANLFPTAYGDRYLKKAQLTLMFIASQCSALGFTCHLDVTAAADYQLPKVLRTLGILHYSTDFAAVVDEGQLIPADGEQERALRAATILACHQLAAHFECTVAELDFWLWQNRNVDRNAKFHLTRTTQY